MLKVFRSSPALAAARYVAGTVGSPEATPSMAIGSAVNTLLIQPELRSDLLIAAKCKSRSAKEFRETSATHSEKLVLTETEMERAEAIANAVLSPTTPAARVAYTLLMEGDGYGEYAVEWDEQVDDVVVPCKCMVDRFRTVGGRPVVVELKTTLDPSPEAFERQAWNLGYHAQAAFNRRGIRRVVGDSSIGVATLVVAVRNEEPYEVAVYEAGPAWMDAGTMQVEDDLRRLARAMKSGEWVAEWEESAPGGVLPILDPPRWARVLGQPVFVE